MTQSVNAGHIEFVLDADVDLIIVKSMVACLFNSPLTKANMLHSERRCKLWMTRRMPAGSNPIVLMYRWFVRLSELA